MDGFCALYVNKASIDLVKVLLVYINLGIEWGDFLYEDLDIDHHDGY